MKHDKFAPHILPTSTSLLGFSMVIFTFLHATGYSERTLIDEFLSVVILMLFCSSILSYFSMHVEKNEEKFEKIADIFFITALFSLTIISLLIVLKFIH